jgi:MoaA/NifB/PqqE/SkfB family radical SAM enzyme
MPKVKPMTVCYKSVDHFPRVLLGASIDLTYRCNNRCRHCWLRLPADAYVKRKELTTDEIRRIADEARTLGVRDWTISGGEPMLRHDFVDILEYLTRQTRSYTLKTNGTLITPNIARLLKRPGETWISVYGATAEVYDRVVGTSGRFEQLMRGIALLNEAGARYVIQLFPMRENWHQWPQMIELANSLGPHWRVGAAWLNLSADGDPGRNREIAAQRLDPRIVVELDAPSMNKEPDERKDDQCRPTQGKNQLLAGCIASRREVHIDPYGGMSNCCVIKDPALRFDLRKGTVRDGWENFIPSLAEAVPGSAAYREGCGRCELRGDCRWCPSYAYLEHRDHSVKVDYLCAVAREIRRFKENWRANHRRFFQVGGITLQIESDLPITDKTFQPVLEIFRVDVPGQDLVKVRHYFSLQGLKLNSLGEVVYRQGAWTVHHKGDFWIFTIGIFGVVFSVGVFNKDYSSGCIYHNNDIQWLHGGLNSLSLRVTDQILLARLLSDRHGCILHSAGAILDGKGLLFVGHSDAGKTTVTRLLEGQAEILCDDRNIVRRWPDGYRIYGTWSHGESSLVSAKSAPLQAVLFLRQSKKTRVIRLKDRKKIMRNVLACLIRGFIDKEWWNKTLDFVDVFSREVLFFELHFEKHGDIVSILRELQK